MKTRSLKLALAVALISAGASRIALAGFDQWQISEIFSSADGSIQFVELSTNAADQGDLSGQSIVASTAAGSQKVFTFPANLAGSTVEKRVLLATPAFTALTGLAPDYVLAAGFVATGGGTVNFAGVASVTYQPGQLPLNGVQSLSGSLLAATASPTNFSGLAATLVAPVPAIFDGVSVLNLPVVDLSTLGVANLSFDVNLATVRFALRNDFYLYGDGIVAGDNAAQLQSGNILFVPALPLGTESYAFRMSLVSDNPITFGNLFDIVVTNTVPTPTPTPTPQPSALEQSISRGGDQYEFQCTVCHGSDGNGTSIGPSIRSSSFTELNSLTSFIDGSMPQGNPGACRNSASSSCSTDVANYIINVIQK